jgi:tetratricopeptide (TPR) repeat protein
MRYKPTKIKQKQVNKVTEFYQKREFDKAKKEALKLLKKDANNEKILILLSVLSGVLQERENEKKYLLKLVSLKSTEPAVYNDLGNLYYVDEAYAEAKAKYEQAIKIDSTYAIAYYGLGEVYTKEEDFTQAEQMLKKAIVIDNNSYQFYNALGNVYKKTFEFDKAEEMYLLSIKSSAQKTHAYANLAMLYQSKKEYALANSAFLKAIALEPENVEIKFNYALFCLENRDYVKGFDLYRYRYHEKKKNNDILFAAEKGLLQKGDDIRGKTLIITHEQGYGDFIQFMRYIPIFEEMGAKVFVYVEKLLAKLFQKNYPDVAFITSDKIPSIEYQYRMPLVDSAYFLGTTYETIPSQETYLHVDAQESKEMYEKYFKGVTKKRVGIVWRTNIDVNEPLLVQQVRQNHSSSLEDFLSYLNVDKVQLYSLQFDATEEEKNLLKQNDILSLGDDLVDFYDNALMIDNLDMVIGIETVSMLIAGAMGKETIVLLADDATWFWGIDTTQTNWFKSIKIVRQDKRDDWHGVLEKAFELLSGKLDTKQAMDMAIEYHKSGKLQEAEELYRTVLRDDPNNAEAYHNLGVIAFNLGYIQEAIGLIQKALTIDPQLDEAFENLQGIIQSLE